MRAEFQQAIRAASQQEARDMVTSIKRAVATEIRAADPSVSVSFTDYFNNTLVPDMVLRWPRENRERLLYVRPNPSDQWLTNGLRHVSIHKPLIFTLEDLASGDTTAPTANRRELAERAHETGTWVTDPSGVAVVSEVRGQKPYLELLSQALVRGGRGVSGGSDVERLAERTDAGFTASRQFSAPGTRQAVQALEDSLDAEQSARLTRVLRAVWEGHGGASSKFPATSSVGSLKACKRPSRTSGRRLSRRWSPPSTGTGASGSTSPRRLPSVRPARSFPSARSSGRCCHSPSNSTTVKLT